VFLLEFGLKLALAPERRTYFLRHWLIDLVASLPFGFVAHQIALAELAAPAMAGAEPGALELVAGVGRMAQILRFARLLLPIARLPTPAVEGADPEEEEREIPVEAVVERLIQMTPEQLIDRMGPAFIVAVDRYLRLLDVPMIRRLPVVRNLVIYREKSPAEA